MIAHLTYPIIVFSFLLLSILGCEEKTAPPASKVIRKPIAEAEKTAQPKAAGPSTLSKTDIEPPPSPKTNLEDETLAIDMANAYNPEGRLDPFQPLFQKKEEICGSVRRNTVWRASILIRKPRNTSPARMVCKVMSLLSGHFTKPQPGKCCLAE